MITRPGYCVDRLKEESLDKQRNTMVLEDVRMIQIHYQHLIWYVLNENDCPKIKSREIICDGCLTINRSRLC